MVQRPGLAGRRALMGGVLYSCHSREQFPTSPSGKRSGSAWLRLGERLGWVSGVRAADGG